MSFNVTADAYLRFMGRYTEPLAVQFAGLAGVSRGQRLPGVDVRQSAAERLPFPDDAFDAAMAQLAELFSQAGLGAVQASTLTVRVGQADFGSWWEPFTLGVGPAGAYLTMPA